MRVLLLALSVAFLVAGCSGEEDDSSEHETTGDRTGVQASGAGSSGKDDLGHQAYFQPTRLVVPVAAGNPLDRVARMAAGLSEGPLGTAIFVNQRPGEGGAIAWRDVAGEEPDGHQLAYVTEGLLALENSRSGVGPDDFEMVAQTDSGSAVLVVREDPEAESLQVTLEDFGDFVSAAKEDPGLVEVADPGPGTVYRIGILALEEEAGIDIAPKTPGKPPTEVIYDGEVEAALVPAEGEVLTDIWAGELRAIAILGEERSEDLPDVPTAKELGYDVNVPVWGGIAVPKGTPPGLVDEMGRAFTHASSSIAFHDALRGTGRRPMQRGPGAFADYVEEQSRYLSPEEPEPMNGR